MNEIPPRYAELERFLIAESRKCVRPPAARFAFAWLSPMPLSLSGAAALRAMGANVDASTVTAPVQSAGDGIAGPQDVFNTGDYSLGMFHHDASEASIELCARAGFLEACRGSLLNFLDNMRADGRVHRVELVHKSHEAEPSKPVMAQFALRCARAADAVEGAGAGARWLNAHGVYERLGAFVGYLERAYTGMHGLALAHSALQTGFDNDFLTVSLPDRTVEDPGMSAFMALEYDAMAELARALGDGPGEARWRASAARIRRLMNQLMWWENADGTGFYVGLQWQHGTAVLAHEIVSDRAGNSIDPMCTWVCLLPLYAGVPDAMRAQKVIALLSDARRFWGPSGVRTAPADGKYYNQAPRSLIFDYKHLRREAVSNWQGPVWILSNYYMAAGLARYGRRDLARELTHRTAELCLRSLSERGSLFECYNDDGRGLWPAHGGFVSWNVLVLTMLREFGG